MVEVAHILQNDIHKNRDEEIIQFENSAFDHSKSNAGEGSFSNLSFDHSEIREQNILPSSDSFEQVLGNKDKFIQYLKGKLSKDGQRQLKRLPKPQFLLKHCEIIQIL